MPRPTLEQIRVTRAGRTGPARRHDRAARRDRRRSSASSPPRSPPTRRTTTTRSSRCSAGSAAADFTYSLDAPVEEGFDGSGHRRGRQVPRSARGLLHPLRVRVRADGPHARDAVAASWSATFRAARPATPSTARPCTRSRAGSCTRGRRCLRGHRMGAVRADRRPRRSDELLGRRIGARRSGRSCGRDARSDLLGVGRPRPLTRRSGVGPERRRGRRDRKHRQPAARPDASCSASCSRSRSPASLRELRRRQMLTAARSGDAAAAWLAVQDAAIDLGIDVPASETPRGTRHPPGGRCTARPPRRDESSDQLRSSGRAMRPAASTRFWQGDAIADAAIAVRAALLRLGRHAAPPAGDPRAALADRSAGQRLRRLRSSVPPRFAR